jgi:hypothetical protein
MCQYKVPCIQIQIQYSFGNKYKDFLGKFLILIHFLNIFVILCQKKSVQNSNIVILNPKICFNFLREIKPTVSKSQNQLQSLKTSNIVSYIVIVGIKLEKITKANVEF